MVNNRARGGVSPSLVNTGQSRTKSSANSLQSRTSKRRFRQLNSWLAAQFGAGCQLLRVDLTSVSSREKSLTYYLKILRKKLENKYKIKINYYKFETSEGYGVLHMIWAIRSSSAVWIPQKLLSDTWEKLTGAKIVYIKRVGNRKKDRTKIANYFISRYLTSDHHAGKIIRASYSWWRDCLPLGKAFTSLLKYCRNGFQEHHSKLSFFKNPITFREFIAGWNSLLVKGYWKFNGGYFHLSGSGRDIYINKEGCMDLVYPSWSEVFTR